MQNRPIKYNFLSNETKIFYLPTSNSFRKYDRFIRDAKLLKFFGMESSSARWRKVETLFFPKFLQFISSAVYARCILINFRDSFQREQTLKFPCAASYFQIFPYNFRRAILLFCAAFGRLGFPSRGRESDQTNRYESSRLCRSGQFIRPGISVRQFRETERSWSRKVPFEERFNYVVVGVGGKIRFHEENNRARSR